MDSKGRTQEFVKFVHNRIGRTAGRISAIQHQLGGGGVGAPHLLQCGTYECVCVCVCVCAYVVWVGGNAPGPVYLLIPQALR